MASIPLPALAVQQQPGPLDQYGKVLSLQSLLQGQKTQQLQQTGLEQENQQRDLAIKDDQTMRSLSPQFIKKDSSGNTIGYDNDGFFNAAAGAGVSRQKLTQMQMQQAQYTEAATKASAAQRDAELAKNKALYETLESIRSVKDTAGRQAALQQALPSLAKQGVDTSKIPQNSPLDDASLDHFEAGLGMHAQALSDAKTAAETAAEEAKQWKEFPSLGTLVNTKTGEIKSVAGQTMTPAMLESKYVNIQTKKNLNQPLSDEDKAFTKSYEHMKELVPQFNINMQNTGGGLGPSATPSAPGAPGGTPKARTINEVPAAIRGEVQQVLDYRRADPSITQRGAVGQAINSWVAELDSQHDATTFPARNKILTEYVKDASSGDIGSINTALGHLGELNTAAQALNQNNVPLLHSIASKYNLATGGDAASTYQMILHRVGPEMTKAYLKGGGTEGERGSNEDDFNISKGAKQIASNIAESAQLLNSKLDSKRKDWDSTFKPYRDADQFDNRFLSPAAKDVLQNLSAAAPTNRGKPSTATSGHTISLNGKNYRYNGSGDTADLKNYTEVKAP